MKDVSENKVDPFVGIEGAIAKELQQMHYSLPDDDALLMAERAYAMAEEHVTERLQTLLIYAPDASLRGVLELWKILPWRGGA